MSEIILTAYGEDMRIKEAVEFCEKFIQSDGRRYICGRNIYADSVIGQLDIAGIIDDFCVDLEYKGIPVIKSIYTPVGALVLVASGGRPLSALGKVKGYGFSCLDYFFFRKYSGLPLVDIFFNEGFESEYEANENEYAWVYGLLADDLSKEIYKKLTSFRLKGDVELLRGFTCREKEQYFEDFLQLAPAGESFVDAGGFDGYTSLQFIRICPEYQSINVFEPDPENFSVCNSRLPQHENIKVHDLGLSDSKKTLKFEMGGVRSRITDVGSMEINVDRLDDVLSSSVTFIKMDIEGAEISAIDGAAGTINEYHPRLGICVYHGAGAFWEIPKKVLSIRDDYRIYLRHYTESIYETVMFFIPIKQHVYGGGWRVR